MKASAGALARMRVCRVRSLFSTVEWLQECGVQVVATALSDRSIPLFKADLSVPTAILMGSEEDGISDNLLEQADFATKIPMVGKIGSLNVSVATGVILYEAVRQRQK